MNGQRDKEVSPLKKVAKSLVLLVGAAALALGISVPAHAQSVTVCLGAHVEIAGQVLVDQPTTCVVLPPPA